MNVALLNIECLSSAKAVEAILKKHQDQIKILITSDPNRGSLKVFISQVWDHLRRSGITFTTYLFCNFILHKVLTHCSYTFSKIIGVQSNYIPLKRLCKDLGIQYLHINNINDPKIIDVLKKLKIDLITIYYFDQILHEGIIRVPKLGVVNFHPAPLPHCRGLHPIIYCAIQNDGKFAVTAHEITDRRIDAGAILAQSSLYQSQEKEIFKLEEAVNLSGVDLYSSVLNNFFSLRENKCIQGIGSYFSHPSRKDIQEIRSKGFQFINLLSYFRMYFRKRSTDNVLTLIQ